MDDTDKTCKAQSEVLERLDGVERSVAQLTEQIARLTLELQQNAYPVGAVTEEDEMQHIADEVNAEVRGTRL